MALVLKDRVKETSTTAGTGTITLNGAVAGFQSFSAVGNANTTYYAIVDPTTGDWEVGLGTYTASGTTLSRDTVLSSSNSGLLVSFVANPKDVFVTYPSEKSVYEDASNVVNATSFGAITATSAALNTGTVSTTPASNTDIANKQYVDTLVSSGITYHTPVKYEVPDTTGNLNATYNNGASGVGATLTNAGALVAFTPDGTVASSGDRIIVYNQTNQFENGVYTVTTVGSGSVAWVLTRATDADTYALKSPNGLGSGDAFFITSGATGAGETYVCNTAGVITFGTTAITFAQISDSTLYTAGTGLTLSGTQFSITNTAVTAATYGSASAVPVFAVNAQGQITGVTDTNIAINGSAVSGNISGSAGSVANALTLGTYLTGGTYNGSSAVTATVDATSANTASKVVARDASGNFSAGTITATLNGTATSTASATNLSGGAANQVVYQSAAGTTAFATAPSASNQVLNWNGSAFTWSAGTISGVPLGSNLNSLTAGTYLTGTAYNGSAAQTWAVDATSANTASKVVARDASGNFSAGTITAALSGNATTTSQTNFSNLTIGGSQVLYAGNYNSYAPTLTGTGASGTWGINITGNASSSSYATYVYSQDIRTLSPSSTSAYRLGFGFTSWANNNTAPYADYLALRSYSDASGGNDNLVTFNKSTIAMRVWQQSFGSASAYSSYADVLMSNNYNSYAPTLTGGGASGTWNISITGSAGSVPTTSVTNLYSPNGASVVSGDASTALPSVGNSLIHTLATGPGGNDGHILGMSWANTTSSYGAQIWVDTDPTNRMSVRSRSSGGAWNSWADVITSWSDDQTKTGYFQSNSSLRAPIFYDSDDTFYYVSPNGNSRLANIGLGGVTPDVRLSINGDAHLAGGVFYLGGTAGSYNSWGSRDYTSSGLRYFNASSYEFNNYGYGSTWTFTLNGGNGQASSSLRAPIFYDSNDTSYYLDPTSGTTSLKVAGALTQGSLLSRPYAVWGEGGTVTGAIVIKLPGTSPSNYGMIHAVIDIYEYNGNNVSTITIGGHNWSTAWYNYGANVTGYTNKSIRLCVVGGQFAIVIGNDSSTWEYGQVVLRKIQNGAYYSGAMDLGGTYSIYRTTSVGASWDSGDINNFRSTTITGLGSVRAPIFYDYNDTGYYLDPAGTSVLNVLSDPALSDSRLYLRTRGDTNHYLWNAGDDWEELVAYSGTGFRVSNSNGAGAILTCYGTDSGNFVQARGSMRAPIFYDSDNTAYYVDPAGTSVFRPGSAYANITDLGNTAPIQVAETNTGTGATRYIPMISQTSTSSSGYRQHTVFGSVRAAVWGSAFIAVGGNDSYPTVAFTFNYGGDFTSPGNVTAYSDERLKTNWRDLPENFVSRLAQVKVGIYDRTDLATNPTQVGVGAQSFQELLPQSITTADDEMGTLSVNYGGAALASAVELAKYVTALEQRIQQLEARL